MENIKATVIAVLSLYIIACSAMPLSSNINNNRTNSTIRSAAIPESNSVHQSIDDLLRSFDETIGNIIKDSQRLQQALVTNFPSNVIATNLDISFPLLKINQVSCNPFQVIERIHNYSKVLDRFVAPLTAIAIESQQDGSRQTSRNVIIRITNALTSLNILQVKMLESFLSSHSVGATSPTIQELTVKTTAYLAQSHPGSHFSAQQVKNIRDYSFLGAVVDVVHTIKSELRQGFPFY